MVMKNKSVNIIIDTLDLKEIVTRKCNKTNFTLMFKGLCTVIQLRKKNQCRCPLLVPQSRGLLLASRSGFLRI